MFSSSGSQREFPHHHQQQPSMLSTDALRIPLGVPEAHSPTMGRLWADFTPDASPGLNSPFRSFCYPDYYAYHPAAPLDGLSTSRPLHPSKVLQIRNLPEDSTEESVKAYCSEYGKVNNLLLIPGKTFGFVEFETMEEAVSCFQRHQEMSKEDRSSATKEEEKAGGPEKPGGPPGPAGPGPAGPGPAGPGPAGPGPAGPEGSETKEKESAPIQFAYSGRLKITKRVNADDNEPNNVLLVTVDNVLYPVTVAVMESIFKKYSHVKRIIIFRRGMYEQALVELEDVEGAKKAQAELTGQNIYTGCNRLKIQYSTLKNLTVSSHHSRCWDFDALGEWRENHPKRTLTPPAERATQLNLLQQQQLVHRSLGAQQQQMGLGLLRTAATPAARGDIMLTPLQRGAATTRNTRDFKFAQQNMLNVLHHQGSVNVSDLYGGPHPTFGQPLSAALTDPALLLRPNVGVPSGSNVLMIKNLNEDQTSPEDLAALCAVYGNVVRVKIMFKKRSTALVQMETPDHCDLVIRYLNNTPLHGQKISIELSRGGAVSSSSSTDAQRLTMEFTDGIYRRHKDKPLKLFPPSNAVHLSNLSDEISLAEVEAFLRPFGEFTEVKFIGPQHRMAIVLYETLENAVDAFVKIHNKPLQGRPVRCAFGRGSSM